MKELGTESAAAHKKLGTLAGQTGFHEIYFTGEDYKHFSAGLAETNHDGPTYIAYEYSAQLGLRLHQALSAGDIVVIKGSRGAKTEQFVEAIEPLNWMTK